MDPTNFREMLVARLLPKDQACGFCNGTGEIGEGYAENFEMKTCRYGCARGRVPAERAMYLRMTVDQLADAVCEVLLSECPQVFSSVGD